MLTLLVLQDHLTFALEASCCDSDGSLNYDGDFARTPSPTTVDAMLRTTGRECVPTHYGHDQLAHSPLQHLTAPPAPPLADPTGGRHCQLGSQPVRSPLQSLGHVRLFPTVLATPVAELRPTRPTVTALTYMTAKPVGRRPVLPPPLMQVPRLEVLYDTEPASSTSTGVGKRPASITASITSEPKRFVAKRSSTPQQDARPGLKLLNQTMIRSQPPLL